MTDLFPFLDFSCEMGQVMNRYDFLESRSYIISQFCLYLLIYCEYGIYGQIMAIKGKYNQMWVNIVK